GRIARTKFWWARRGAMMAYADLSLRLMRFRERRSGVFGPSRRQASQGRKVGPDIYICVAAGQPGCQGLSILSSIPYIGALAMRRLISTVMCGRETTFTQHVFSRWIRTQGS